MESLGPDKTEALRKLKVAVGRMQETLNAAREEQKPKSWPMVPTTPGRALSLRNLAGAHFDSEMAIDDAERSFDPADMPPNTAALYQPAYEVMLRNVASGRFSDAEALAAVGWAIDSFQAQGNTKVVRGTPEWRELARTLGDCEVARYRPSVGIPRPGKGKLREDRPTDTITRGLPD